MRCFIGIQLPSYVKNNLYELQKKISSEYAKIKWVEKKNLHVSLKFLGQLDEEQVKLTREALMNVKFKKFMVSLGDLGWFPSKEKVRVIWVDLNPKKEILELHGDVELKLGGLFEKDSRFEVHLTLGRVKFVKNKERFFEVLKNIKVKWDSFLIREFCLFQSVLSKDGPTYTVLERYGPN